jgi:dUTP pyrophosphatase
MNLITSHLVHENSTSPEFLFPMAMGYSLFSCETKLINCGRKEFVSTGISLDIPHGSYVQVVGRMSMQQIGVFTSSMTFDGSFKGEIKVLIHNESANDLPILIGDKIANLIVLPLDPPVLIQHRNQINEEIET